MNKTEFVEHVAHRTGADRAQAAATVDAVLAVIEETLARGGEVSISGFGKFQFADRAARQGVNPRTGEAIEIAAARVPKFTAGSGLKNAIKG